MAGEQAIRISAPVGVSRLAIKWAALTSASALPTSLFVWTTMSAVQRLGMVAGVGAWICVMIHRLACGGASDSLHPGP
jgi:hypothetical protein